MKRIEVSASKKYDVVIGRGILHDLGTFTANISRFHKIAVITDKTVGSLYQNIACDSLSASGFCVYPFVFEGGEQNKTSKTVEEILGFLFKNGFTRRDAIIALGGGVVGDVAGFAASVYMRGIAFINVPTSLLAQVDSSVGGKTGINTEYGKNLVGSFYQPSLVIEDTELLSTLSEKEYKNGLGEIIKYAVLDKTIYELLSDDAPIENIITRCVEYKSEIVEKDEKDAGDRAILNLGHTVGHAIEKATDFEVSHGEAVAIGTYYMLERSLNHGLIGKEDFRKITELYAKLGLKSDMPCKASDLSRYIIKDKKSDGDRIELIIPMGIGSVKRQKYTLNEAKEMLSIE